MAEDKTYSWIGPVYIILCMLLRASDLFFRKSLTQIFPNALVIIVTEHVLGFLLLLPLILWTLPKLKSFTRRDWGALLFVAMGGSVMGIYCFTKAFTLVSNPALVILLQKIQPLFTILLACVYLKEKPTRRFWGWAAGAIICAVLLSMGQSFSLNVQKAYGLFFAVAAALFWGWATVFGKDLLAKLSFGEMTALRYGFGAPFALILLGLHLLTSAQGFPWQQVLEPANLARLAYMAYLPGMAALLLFYKGLVTTQASVASICELFFPLAAIMISWLYFKQPLDNVQIVAAVGLWISITMISRENR